VVPAQFVPTDADGVQRSTGVEVRWPLPTPDGARFEPGAVLDTSGAEEPVLLSSAELLDHLDARVFLAEQVGEGRAARLIAPTKWSESVAARFSLDCVGHVLARVGDAASTVLTTGMTLAEVLENADTYLERGTGEDGARFGTFARIAAAHRLKRAGDQIGSAAFAEALRAESADEEVLDDPVWDTLAACRDAVLAVVDAVRHVSAPMLAELDGHGAGGSGKSAGIQSVETPWGAMSVGGGRKYVASHVAARDAAERARTAIGEVEGPDAEHEELEWQRRRLEELLRAG